ncbi:Uncharacterised protein g11093 [Pycnogonum litorale]
MVGVFISKTLFLVVWLIVFIGMEKNTKFPSWHIEFLVLSSLAALTLVIYVVLKCKRKSRDVSERSSKPLKI